MSHLPAPHTVYIVGQLVGATAICIAVAFQMISSRDIPIKYTFGFFALGSAVILANTETILTGDFFALSRVISMVAILVIELVTAFYVYEHYE